MSAKLHHTLIQASGVAASTSAAGFPVSNILLTPVRRPWRSTSTAANSVDIDLGAVYVAPTICLQAPNAPTVTMSYGQVAYTTTNAGTQTLALDRHGRRKHSLSLVGNVRYVRINFGASAPDDSAAYYELGAVFPFATTLALPEDPLLGSEAVVQFAQERVQLPNGTRFPVERGAPRQQLSLRMRGQRTADLDQLTRRARAAVCWLDLDVAANRELQWPVRHDGDRAARSLARANQDESTLELVEVA